MTSDAIFTTHRDVRDLYGSNRHTFRTSDRRNWHLFGLPFGKPKDSGAGSGSEPWERTNLRDTFGWYTQWIPLATYDMHYDDMIADEISEIRIHTRLLGLSENDVDPALVQSLIAEALRAAKHDRHRRANNVCVCPHICGDCTHCTHRASV